MLTNDKVVKYIFLAISVILNPIKLLKRLKHN